jgi:hypothetical protein
VDVRSWPKADVSVRSRVIGPCYQGYVCASLEKSSQASARSGVLLLRLVRPKSSSAGERKELASRPDARSDRRAVDSSRTLGEAAQWLARHSALSSKRLRFAARFRLNPSSSMRSTTTTPQRIRTNAFFFGALEGAAPPTAPQPRGFRCWAVRRSSSCGNPRDIHRATTARIANRTAQGTTSSATHETQAIGLAAAAVVSFLAAR